QRAEGGGVHGVRLILPAPGQDRNAGRTGGAGGRSGRNGSNGTHGCSPVSASASTRPVAAESWMPDRKWPAATHRLSNPGTRPIDGRPSRLPGRSPAQHRSTAASANAGTSSTANRINSPTAAAVVDLSKPASSSVEPTN